MPIMMIKTLRSCVGGYQKLNTFGSFRTITNTRHVLFSNGSSYDEEKSLTRNNLANLRLTQSYEPIPFSADVDFSPINKEGDEKIGHKKVTIVGCGQVGMAIAYSMLNQVTAGAIALVDQNREKLEGEAKDLEQGSAFHQHVRILASDEYVSRKVGKH